MNVATVLTDMPLALIALGDLQGNRAAA
jgi:hypothetical protein